MEKKKYTIEELNQYIIAAEKLIDYYVNLATIQGNMQAKEASQYRVIKEKLLQETEKLLLDLGL